MSVQPRSPTEPVVRTELPGLPAPKRGKVRDVYDLGDRLLIVATDRLSAYDHILSPGIPDKGKLLHQMSAFWFERLAGIVPHHLLAGDLPEELAPYSSLLAGRSALVRKARVFPFECVARGYLAGSGYREYREGGAVCGLPLPSGLVRASRLPEPIFTPATKAEEGHDENVTFERMAADLGGDLAARLRDLTLTLYSTAAKHAESVGLILADTKFEFGLDDRGEILWIDEALTPDSSRYWEAATWHPGTEPASFDKQFVRNWLDASGWDHQSPPPRLPEDVVAGTRERYLEAFRRVVGREPAL
ncbi:MAG TPA: phosphoribosylaminoimidazolesuccinocarboxamide synthase [Thermoanaerobaculia bacterium]|nr:phosphoribosylaminoimidazolesuccinocarboxamide synthase [Thermoanaerobaculia bacterium]